MLGKVFHSFKLKIAGVFFLFVLFILSVFGVVLYKEFKERLMQEMQESMQNRLENVSYNLEMFFESIKLNATMLSLDNDIVYIVQKPQNTATYDYFKRTLEVKEKLTDSINTHEILKSIYLISKEEEFFLRTDMRYTFDYQKVCQQDWTKEISGIQKNKYLRLSADTLTEKEPEDTLSYVVPVKSSQSGKVAGYLCANVGYSTIEEYFRKNEIGESGEYLVYDSEKIIFASGSDVQFAQSVMDEIGFGNYQGQKIINDYLISYKWSEEMNWMYVAKIPMSEVTAPTESIGRLPWILGLCSVPIIGICAVFLSHMFFSPINTLKNSMSVVGDGKYVLIEQQRKDEFGVVFHDFNRMTDRIFTLMDKLCLQETLTKELAIKNLQAQLSPHFLYNTLDAIHWAARVKDMDAVSQMTFLLSKYFRKNLSNGQDWVTVREVAEMIKSYMDIQSLRFMDGFSYTMEVDEQVADKKVPKSLFQPIVENALYHGIERSSQEGFCSISWKDAEGKICFCVKDNGKGMSEEELHSIMQNIEEERCSSNENFALRNIQKQLKLYYGEKIHMKSELEKGTEVYFFLKQDEEGKDV